MNKKESSDPVNKIMNSLIQIILILCGIVGLSAILGVAALIISPSSPYYDEAQLYLTTFSNILNWVLSIF